MTAQVQALSFQKHIKVDMGSGSEDSSLCRALLGFHVSLVEDSLAVAP